MTAAAIAAAGSAASSNDLRRYRTLFAVLILACFAYREWIALSTPITLFYDEAYYLDWAQTPDWGYYSKPPVVAWLIALTTALFGLDEWAVKLASPLLYSLSALLIFAIGQRLSGPRAGYLSGLVFLLMPLVSFNSLFITTDAPLLFFWTAALYALVRAEASNTWLWWLLAGLCGGLGLLSKYSFILLPAGVLGYALVSPRGRLLLRNARFWSACALAAAMLLPNLYWNYQHDFISFQHTAEISQQGHKVPSLGRLLEFWAGQLFVFGPVFALLLIGLMTRRPSGDGEKLLWCLFWPTLITLSLQALLARANLNWAAAAYVSASLLVGCELARRASTRWLRSGIALNLLLMLGFYHYAQLTGSLGIERGTGNDPFKRLHGWPELARRFQPDVERYPGVPLASDSRKLLAYFGYYLDPPRFGGFALNSDGHVGDQYELTHSLHSGDDRPYLFISEDPAQDRLQRYFTQVEALSAQKVEVYPGLERSAWLYFVRGFKGYGEHADD